jgi:RNA polymerase sigma factor (sigma-70 family)
MLFAEHGRMVLGLCRLLLRDPVEAEDAAQQVFLSAHQAILRGSPPRDRAAWMAAIARNECRARIRERMRDPLMLPELPSDLPDPLVAAIRAADLRAVWTALGALPRRQRNALVLRELGGLSYHELGRALGVSQSAVESLLFRARQQIRSLIAGANAAAAPLALRDQLTQLIPGFDPASAGLVARVAAVPVALKVAGAAVGVGVVATGVGEARHQSAAQPQRRPQEATAVVALPVHRAVRQNVQRVERVVRVVPASAHVTLPHDNEPARRQEVDHEAAVQRETVTRAQDTSSGDAQDTGLGDGGDMQPEPEPRQQSDSSGDSGD